MAATTIEWSSFLCSTITVYVSGVQDVVITSQVKVYASVEMQMHLCPEFTQE